MLDGELGARYESEVALNGLHPAHLNQHDGPSVLWIDFCNTKECSGVRMDYSRLTKDAAMVAAFVRQMDFIVRQAASGTVHGPEVEPFLEYGWREMPAIPDRLAELKRALNALEPTKDFHRPAIQKQARDAIAIAAGNLQEAEAGLDGLDVRVQELFRAVEPEYAACEETQRPGEVAFVPSPAELEALETLANEMGEPPPTSSEPSAQVLSYVVRRGLSAIDADRRRAEAEGPVELEKIEASGPVGEPAVRAWLVARSDSLVACLSAREPGPLPFEAQVYYAPNGGVGGVEVLTEGVTSEMKKCLIRALEVGDFQVVEGVGAHGSGGTVVLSIVLRLVDAVDPTG